MKKYINIFLIILIINNFFFINTKIAAQKISFNNKVDITIYPKENDNCEENDNPVNENIVLQINCNIHSDIHNSINNFLKSQNNTVFELTTDTSQYTIVNISESGIQEEINQYNNNEYHLDIYKKLYLYRKKNFFSCFLNFLYQTKYLEDEYKNSVYDNLTDLNKYYGIIIGYLDSIIKITNNNSFEEKTIYDIEIKLSDQNKEKSLKLFNHIKKIINIFFYYIQKIHILYIKHTNIDIKTYQKQINLKTNKYSLEHSFIAYKNIFELLVNMFKNIIDDKSLYANEKTRIKFFINKFINPMYSIIFPQQFFHLIFSLFTIIETNNQEIINLFDQQKIICYDFDYNNNNNIIIKKLEKIEFIELYKNLFFENDVNIIFEQKNFLDIIFCNRYYFCLEQDSYKTYNKNIFPIIEWYIKSINEYYEKFSHFPIKTNDLDINNTTYRKIFDSLKSIKQDLSDKFTKEYEQVFRIKEEEKTYTIQNKLFSDLKSYQTNSMELYSFLNNYISTLHKEFIFLHSNFETFEKDTKKIRDKREDLMLIIQENDLLNNLYLYYNNLQYIDIKTQTYHQKKKVFFSQIINLYKEFASKCTKYLNFEKENLNIYKKFIQDSLKISINTQLEYWKQRMKQMILELKNSINDKKNSITIIEMRIKNLKEIENQNLIDESIKEKELYEKEIEEHTKEINKNIKFLNIYSKTNDENILKDICFLHVKKLIENHKAFNNIIEYFYDRKFYKTLDENFNIIINITLEDPKVNTERLVTKEISEKENFDTFYDYLKTLIIHKNINIEINQNLLNKIFIYYQKANIKLYKQKKNSFINIIKNILNKSFDCLKNYDLLEENEINVIKNKILLINEEEANNFFIFNLNLIDTNKLSLKTKKDYILDLIMINDLFYFKDLKIIIKINKSFNYLQKIQCLNTDDIKEKNIILLNNLKNQTNSENLLDYQKIIKNNILNLIFEFFNNKNQFILLSNEEKKEKFFEILTIKCNNIDTIINDENNNYFTSEEINLFTESINDNLIQEIELLKNKSIIEIFELIM